MFEVITEQEFKGSSVPPHKAVPSAAAVSGTDALDSEWGGEETDAPAYLSQTSPLIYCDFCKGYYYEEYHYGERG